MSITHEELNNKKWYRLLKVLFSMTIVGTFLTTYFVGLETWPRTKTIQSVQVECKDGTVVNTSWNAFQLAREYHEDYGWDELNDTSINLDQYKIERISEECGGQSYVEIEKTETIGSISEFTTAVTTTFLGILLTLFLLRWIFFYVVFGNLPRKK